jgi:hypothetical protein
VFEGVEAGAVSALGSFGASGEAAVAAGLLGARDMMIGHVDGRLPQAGRAGRRRIARMGAARGGFLATCRKRLKLKRRLCCGGCQRLPRRVRAFMVAGWGDRRRQRHDPPGDRGVRPGMGTRATFRFTGRAAMTTGAGTPSSSPAACGTMARWAQPQHRKTG